MGRLQSPSLSVNHRMRSNFAPQAAAVRAVSVSRSRLPHTHAHEVIRSFRQSACSATRDARAQVKAHDMRAGTCGLYALSPKNWPLLFSPPPAMTTAMEWTSCSGLYRRCRHHSRERLIDRTPRPLPPVTPARTRARSVARSYSYCRGSSTYHHHHHEPEASYLHHGRAAALHRRRNARVCGRPERVHAPSVCALHLARCEPHACSCQHACAECNADAIADAKCSDTVCVAERRRDGRCSVCDRVQLSPRRVGGHADAREPHDRRLHQHLGDVCVQRQRRIGLRCVRPECRYVARVASLPSLRVRETFLLTLAAAAHVCVDGSSTLKAQTGANSTKTPTPTPTPTSTAAPVTSKAPQPSPSTSKSSDESTSVPIAITNDKDDEKKGLAAWAWALIVAGAVVAIALTVFTVNWLKNQPRYTKGGGASDDHDHTDSARDSWRDGKIYIPQQDPPTRAGPSVSVAESEPVPVLGVAGQGYDAYRLGSTPGQTYRVHDSAMYSLRRSVDIDADSDDGSSSIELHSPTPVYSAPTDGRRSSMQVPPPPHHGGRTDRSANDSQLSYATSDGSYSSGIDASFSSQLTYTELEARDSDFAPLSTSGPQKQKSTEF